MAVTKDFVKITAKAQDEVRRLISAEGKPDIGLRLGVKGGGCSGLSYDLAIHAKGRWRYGNSAR